jgi:hypothetical protein
MLRFAAKTKKCEDGGRGGGMDSMDALGLGVFQVCLKVGDLKMSLDFYTAFGFQVKEGFGRRRLHRGPTSGL